MTIIAGTGHRPDKLGGYSIETTIRLTRFAIQELRYRKPSYVISGMAQGWDQALAYAATELHIPWAAYIPFAGQESRWPQAAQEEYGLLLSKADRQFTVCGGEYAAYKMQKRNERMVNDCDLLLALYNGTPGGTANCVRYARMTRRVIVANVWEQWALASLQYNRG